MPFVLSSGMSRLLKHPVNAGTRTQTCPGASALGVGLMPAQLPREAPAEFAVSLASSGGQAIELMKVLRFDLLLVSPTLPDMTVWRFAETVRQFWPWQRWMLVTNEATPDHVRCAGEHGAAGICANAQIALTGFRPAHGADPPGSHRHRVALRPP